MHDAVLLAGGKSSRMGVDKTELLIAGQTQFERAQALLASIGSERILVSGKHSSYINVPDIIPDAGPPAGIYSILRYLNEQGLLENQPLLVIPVDMPLLTNSLLLQLINAMGDARAVRYRQQIFPCVLRASSGLLIHMEKLYTESSEPGGKRSMHALLEFTDAKELAVPDEMQNLFVNINSPQDLALLPSLNRQAF